MRPALIIDVETRPDPAIEASAAWWQRYEDALELPGNIKDELKLEDWRQEKLGKARSKMALNARTGCIAMVGCAELDDDDAVEVFRADGDLADVASRGSEGILLKRLSSYLFDLPSTGVPVIGWNVRKFDVPFLLARCALHDVALPRWFPNMRSYRHLLVDLLDDIYGAGPMSEWRFVFGKGFKEIEGADLLTVPLDELEAHLRDDLEDTKMLARRTEWAWRE